MVDKFKIFIDNLARIKVSQNVFNQYSYNLRENNVRRDNLLIYLKQMKTINPSIMFVAEAPGYRGSRLTGVPLVSEYQLMNDIGLDLFGEKNGYKMPSKDEKLLKQATTTIMWNVLLERNVIPLAWNAFPFHPHKADNEKSNRTPTKKELIIGESFLLGMINMFNINEIVAVGNKAKESLDKLNIESTKVRHPAQGGKNDFVKGIDKILNDRS